MKIPKIAFVLFIIALTGGLAAGCGKKHGEGGHDHAKEEPGSDEEGHGHEESPSGASFKAGKGVILTEETRQSIGLKTIEVDERAVPLEIRFSAQVFGEDHKTSVSETNHFECTAKASGLLTQDKAGKIRAGQTVQLTGAAGQSFGGMVIGVGKTLAFGDAEVVVGITNSAAQLKPGSFVSAIATIVQDRAGAAIPKTAVLRTAEGAFAYTLNGDAYFRTPIKIGAESGGFVEVTDGLLSGDVVVTQPVEKLWLIELRATKGGGHSH